MSLKFHPSQGMVLICDYSTGFIHPEMIKKRPVVVVSPRFRRGKKLCSVVPLSTTSPNPIEDHHHKLNCSSLPGKFSRNETWAKCDMITTVSLDRLDRVKLKDKHGKRLFVSHRIMNEDLQAIIRCLLNHLGLKRLIQHL